MEKSNTTKETTVAIDIMDEARVMVEAIRLIEQELGRKIAHYRAPSGGGVCFTEMFEDRAR